MNLKSILCSALFGATLTATSVFANTVWITDLPNDGGLHGGEFFAHTSNNGNFITFCLEKNVDVRANTVYDYTIADSAFSGGPDLHSPGAGDPVSAGTSYLFAQFFHGSLVDSDGVGSYYDHRWLNAGLLQKAFWVLEDEYAPAAYVGGTNYYVDLVLGIFGAGAYANAGPDSQVKAMNLTLTIGRNIYDVQSMLVYVPDSGMTAALLGLGLLSLAAFRRKL